MFLLPYEHLKRNVTEFRCLRSDCQSKSSFKWMMDFVEHCTEDPEDPGSNPNGDTPLFFFPPSTI